MKIACSSASFAREIAAGTLTQLEWLDACANELEVDGVVFDVAHFPRTDVEYCAQLKKASVDLGLTVVAVAASDLFAAGGDAHVALALALGAPLAIGHAAARNDAADAWGAFVAEASARARAAKTANVTLAVRARAGTVCATGAELRRLAKDVDSAWLRFALEPATLADTDAATLRPKAAIAWHEITDCTTFATAGDADASAVVAMLARFRGFVVLDGEAAPGDRGAYHAAIERFATLRARALAPSA